MRLSARTVGDLAELVCGASGGGGGFEWPNFPYRSSSRLTEFFRNCDLEYIHQGETRKWWVEEVLKELNKAPSSSPHLPPDNIIRVVQELLDPLDFQRAELDQDAALEDLNTVFSRDGLEVYLDGSRRAHVRNRDTEATSANLKIQSRPLTDEELRRRAQAEGFLENASEDEIIEELLVPLFRQLNFLRVSPTGHRDRSLEFGKDLWMKYQLPTGHYIYFGAQVKREKIDAAASDLTKNISAIIAQAEMMLDSPVFDPENNRKHLLDHIFIISGGEITKQAKQLIGQNLDQEARRHLIFMDREELLDLLILTSIRIPGEEEGQPEGWLDDDELPF